MNKLDAIENARKRRLVNHFKSGLILFKLFIAARVELCQSLEKDKSTEAFKTRPIVTTDVNVDLFGGLVELLGVNLFTCEVWQLLDGIELGLE